MQSDEPYVSPAAALESDQIQKPLFWSRMVRYSIHFTILGVILAGLKIYASLQHPDSADPLDGMSARMTPRMVKWIE